MANVRTLQRSFGGGEVSPEMFGRIDDQKYQAGMALCRNFIVKPQGPVENRPGTQFVREVKDSTKAVRLIPFTYSTDQTMVLEFGNQYIRFHTQGATLMDGDDPYEVATPYLEAHLFDLHYVQSADVLTIVHPSYAPRELRRLGALDWSLDELSFTPKIQPPLGNEDLAPVPVTHSYKITALKRSVTGITNESLPSDAATCSNDLAIPGSYNELTWTRYDGAIGYRVYKLSGAVYGFLGTANQARFLDDGASVVPTSKIPPTSGASKPRGLTATAVTASVADVAATATVPSGADNLTTQEYVVTSVKDSEESIQSSTASCSNNLFVTGAYNSIEWPAANGAASYNVYKRSGGVFGYIGQSTSTSFTDDNIAPDMSMSPPNISDPFITAGNYPGAVSYFEQRRCFAGTTNEPQKIWMTKSGTESNMSYSLPVKDDDRIEFRVAAREANTIRHVVPLSQLLLLTAAAEWRVTSVNSDAITPTSVAVRPQSYIGASNVQPSIVNNNLIYCAARGGHVRECSYNWQANGFITGDLSLRAAHLFDSLEITDMAFSKAPQPVLWFVSSNGKLLGLTYIPEQQVGAWHQHDTDGAFESCAVVAEGVEDALYVIVKRTIDGESVRYVERLASRQFVDQADAFFVDCGLTYDGVAADEISGLTHLEGKVVNILADGAVHPQRTVTDGAITLDVEASVVQIGLPITADIQTLPVAMQIDSGYGQGRMKNVNKVWLRCYRSSGIFVGPDADNLVEAKTRTTELYGDPPALISDEVQIVLTPAWASGGQVYVRQEAPLPLTIVSMTMEISVGG